MVRRVDVEHMKPRFTDEILLISETSNDIHEMMNDQNGEILKMGLKNINQTEVILNCNEQKITI